VLAALGPVGAAWLELRPTHALLAHAVALAAALSVLFVAPGLSVSMGREVVLPAPRARFSTASVALAWLFVALSLGALVQLL
jgi:hypothetical protein